MARTTSYQIEPVGWVESPLHDLDAAPRQPDEGAPPAYVVVRPEVSDAMSDLRVGDRVVLLTWLHQADRSVLSVHPRSDTSRPLEGVFSTRSPDRPNPIGLHEVTIVGVEPGRIGVDGLEAIDGTPVVDIKPVLGRKATR
jgi:tRNA-Thr(GGU) m(6)t(6)A37 methyltransferase TsaA